MPKKLIMVYCAGPYTGPDVVAVLGNMRRGLEEAMDLAEMGFCVEAPWLDFQYGLKRDWPLHIYQDMSLEKLRRSDCIYMLKGWETSKGATRELKLAGEWGKLSFCDKRKLKEWADNIHDVDALREALKIVSATHNKSAPRPEFSGKAHKVKRQKLGFTVDLVLANLLWAEGIERRVTCSALMDDILWNHYGRPLLSFEKPIQKQITTKEG